MRLPRPSALFFAFLLSLPCACSGPPPLDPKDPPTETGSPDTGAPDTDEPEVDPSDALYDPEQLLQVEITMDRDHWRELQEQTRDFWGTLGGEDCQEQPFENPFTWFPADVSLDGAPFETVGVRKKGFLGSLSEDKPALKIDLARFGEPRTFLGVEDITLNNSLSDPSYLRQCLGYAFFRDAGLPASRCAFARVTVNGQDLGLYVNVEPIKDPLIERHFSSADGNLYEGTLSDFREGWTGTFEKKNNEEEDDWSDIDAMVQAFDADDDELIARLEPLMDLEAFYRHWAAEVIITHVDGYANNTNNFYLYKDPESDRFFFLPWGIDELMTPAEERGDPQSVFAWAILPNRLYGIDEGKARYLEVLGALLEELWNEKIMLERLESMGALVQEQTEGEERELAAAEAEDLRVFIESRRDEILPEIERGGARWPYEPRENYCFVSEGTLVATFETWWGSILTEDPFTSGEFELKIDWEDYAFEFSESGSVVGSHGGASALYMAAWVSSTEAILVYYTAPEETFEPGTVSIDLGEVMGALFYIDTTYMKDFELLTYVVGDMVFDQASTETGDPVTGTLYGELLDFG